ncbi:hypothetical protein DL764_009846 [Monosporascus ibericus]|uniref:Uncharacterized protein n=1 Tax=Monosporascus ibericus TaxID=155417 RepID=A0A4Q4SX01_9PEZI|nr:hypothetical protein DL764_009846 [Monosporascus ibericus]
MKRQETRMVWKKAKNSRSPVGIFAPTIKKTNYEAEPEHGRTAHRCASWTQAATPSRLATADRPSQLLKSKFSFARQIAPLSPILEQMAQDRKDDEGGWLAEAEKGMRRDLATSKRELELIKGIAEDIERRLLAPGGQPMSHNAANTNINNGLRDQKVLLAACQEYSRSRIHLLKQRLRQVAFWSSGKEVVGHAHHQKTPKQAPVGWATADGEWRDWLYEQAVARTGKHAREPHAEGQHGADSSLSDASWKLWRPLSHILAGYTWQVEERSSP